MPQRIGSERIAGIVGLALIVLTAVLAIWLSRPPRPLPVDAPVDRFSAGRAMADVRRLAEEPRPIGSAAHVAARDYLLGRLSELELSPEVQTVTAVRPRGESRIQAARVRNLVGRTRGQGDGGVTLLVAHYDSRPNTPGAGDDAAGVAVVLEVVRALSQGPPLAGELIVLLADGEELGLLGARGFAAEHTWMSEVDRVLNFEARGSGGPTAMIETGPADLSLVRRFGRAAPHPLASSLSAAVYARMPNDTDFSVFREAGLSGLNFAFIGGLNAYHSSLDTADRLDPASLQHAGDNALALVRELDAGDVGSSEPGGTWFNPVGGWLLVVPAGAVPPIALTLAALTLTLVAVGARRQLLDVRAVGPASVFVLLALAAMPLAAAVTWRLFTDNAPALLDTPHGLPHRLGLAGMALFLAGFAVLASLGALTRRRRPVETALGVALPWALLALVAAALAPQAAFLFWWPLWGLIGGAAVVLLTDPPVSRALLWLTLGALPGAAVLAPLAVFVFQALTPHLAAAALAPAALLACLALPSLLAATGERQGIAGAALVSSLLALAGSVWGTPSEHRPQTVDLVRLDQPDLGSGFRLSRDERPHAWVVRQLGGRPESEEGASLSAVLAGPLVRGPREASPAIGPSVEEMEDLRLDGRQLKVRVRSPAGAPMLYVEARSTVQITAVELAGERFERGAEESAQPLSLELAGFSPAGLEVSFWLPDRWPVELSVTEQFYGLPEAPLLPAELMPSGAWTSHSRLVHRSFLR